MKKLASILVCCAMSLTMAVAAFADPSSTTVDGSTVTPEDVIEVDPNAEGNANGEVHEEDHTENPTEARTREMLKILEEAQDLPVITDSDTAKLWVQTQPLEVNTSSLQAIAKACSQESILSANVITYVEITLHQQINEDAPQQLALKEDMGLSFDVDITMDTTRLKKNTDYKILNMDNNKMYDTQIINATTLRVKGINHMSPFVLIEVTAYKEDSHSGSDSDDDTTVTDSTGTTVVASGKTTYTSPKTGDAAVYGVALLLLVMGGACVAVRKHID